MNKDKLKNMNVKKIHICQKLNISAGS